MTTSLGLQFFIMLFLVACESSEDDPMYVMFLNVKTRGAPCVTYHFTDCYVTSRVVVMVMWLAHVTSNPGYAGSISTHGIGVFSFIKNQLVFRTSS